MKQYAYWQLDVFTDRPFGGNQLAVFPDAQGLSSEEMMTLTRELNYSESTFVFPAQMPGTACKVRIFTPGMEMPMAGHPTVGTAAVMAAKGRIQVPAQGGEIVLELAIGPVPVVYEPAPPGALPFVWMQHRAPTFDEPRTDRQRVAHALGVQPDEIRADLPIQVVSTGVPFLFVPLTGLSAMHGARSEAGALAELFERCAPAHLALFCTETVEPDCRVHARMFSPHLAGIVEDAATGSMAAPLGAYLAQHGLLGDGPLSRFAIEQGLEMQRPSRIEVEVGHLSNQVATLRIGGRSILVGEGQISW